MRGDGRDRGDAIQQGSHIEAGAARQDRYRAFGVKRGDFVFGGIGPIRSGAGLRPVPGAEKPVLDPLHLVDGRPRAEDCEIGIDLCAVRVDNDGAPSLTLERKRKTDGTIALAARGRPCNERQRRQRSRHVMEIPLLIARLIADPTGYTASLDAATAALEAQGMRVAMARMDDVNSPVLQISLPDGDREALSRVLDAHFRPSDLLISDDEIRMPHLLISDMDSTMIGQECIDELADFAGLKEQIADITERAMQGELDFESALRERVMLLRELSEGAITECLSTRIEPMPGAKTLVATLRAKGCRTVLVTGGFHQFADPVAEQLGFERVVGNRLEVSHGALTGGLIGPITDSSVKKAVLLEETAQLGDGAVSLATGDGANDIPMLEAATYGIAYRAKPKARAAANGWIDRGDLTAILHLLRIDEQEWIHC